MTVDLQAPEIRAAIALVEATLAYEQRDRKIPGLSTGIVYDQALIWQHGYGYGNVEQQIPADENTVYRVASLTKLFTSTMLMLLRDAGKVNLDDPIENYLPEFKIKSRFADARPPTFRQMAAHATGLPREGVHENWKGDGMPSIGDLLAALDVSEMLMPMMVEPKYSNLGISIMGYALGKIAGKPYDVFVQETILKPLGMNDSGFDRDRYGDDHYGVGYRRGPNSTMIPVPDFAEDGWRPAGGLYSTVADISRFMALQFTDAPADASAGGKQILGSSTLREMRMPVSIAPDFSSGYGIGWGIRRVAGEKVIGHGGSLPGFTTNITLAPALKLGMITFTNRQTEPSAISQRMMEILIPAFKLASSEPPPTAEVIASWKPYLGRYRWEMLDSDIEIRVVKERLMAVTVGEDPSGNVTLTPADDAGAHSFNMSGGGSGNELCVFVMGDDGKAAEIWMGSYPYHRIGDEE